MKAERNRLVRQVLGNIFLRVYVGMLGALILIVLLSVAIVATTNLIREEAYQENLLSGLFSTLINEVSPLPPELRTYWVEELNRTLGIELSLQPLNEKEWSSWSLERFHNGRVIVDHRPTGELQVSRQLPGEPTLLVGRLWRVTEQQASASIYLILRDLQRTPMELRHDRLKTLQSRFRYDIALLDQLPRAVDPLQRQRLDRGEQVVLFSDDTQTVVSYAQIGPSTWLQLGPIALFNQYPVSLLAGVSLMALLLLGTATWWFIRTLEKRLRQVEKAASQIAAGNLNSRVATNSTDFVSRLARSFNRMAEQVQGLLRTQQEMIHAVSHELRTPVARVRFGMQMIEDFTDDPAIHKQLAGIDKDIDELNELVDEILTYARLGQDGLKLSFARSNVVQLTRETVQSFQRTQPQLTLVLDVSGSHAYQGDASVEPRYFQRAVQNLVGNAIRYARHRIRVRCHFEAETLRVDVEDDGEGIPEHDWERVFAPFSRLDDSRARSSGDYGLGLSIVQRITYWHRGGALVDRSPTLQGARFSLVLPREQLDSDPPLRAPI